MRLVDATSVQWRKWYAQCDPRTVYQDPLWLEMIEQAYPRLPIHRLACVTDQDAPLWLLPLVEIKPIGKRIPMLISLPFANYGGFINSLQEGSAADPGRNAQAGDECRSAMLRQFLQSGSAGLMEIRQMEKPDAEFHVDDTYTHFELHLPDHPDRLWKLISGNARTGVRKAEKEEVRVFFDPPDKNRIFTELNEKNATFHGTPVHSQKWFHLLMDLFGGEARIAVAQYRDRNVGAALILIQGKRAILHSLTPDPDFRHLCVSDKLVWECMKFVTLQNAGAVFDFGRTRPDNGQLFFKRKWGGVEKPIYYTYLLKKNFQMPRFHPERPVFRVAGKIWRHLPSPVTRFIGPYLRVRIPS